VKKFLKALLPDSLFRMVSRMRSVWRNRSFKGSSSEKIFTEIYRKNAWGGKSVSGMGSDHHQTHAVRMGLPMLLRKYGIQSILDLPCGDFEWMQQVDLHDFEYTGGDIVPDLIERNQKQYGSSRRNFRVLNLTTDALPDVDMLLCRDCLIHLSLHDIGLAVDNILRSKIKYLLTTTYPLVTKNSDIVTGDFRAVNLILPPFSFPNPLEFIEENLFPDHRENPNFIRVLGLWRVSDLCNLKEVN
jgi:hypothetical protein